MKRILSLFAAVLLAALIIVPAAHAEGGGPAVFSMNSVENVSPGQSFTVTLSISGDYQVHGMNLSIEFDPNSMTLESCDQGGYLNEIRANSGIALLDTETLVGAGKIKLGVIMPMDPATGSGDVLIMKFHVNEGVTVNQQVIMVIHEFIYMPLSAKTGTDVPFSTHNSIITLRGGATPEAGYNEGDDGIGNNISSSPSLPPDPTPASAGTPVPGTTPAPRSENTPAPGTTPAPGGYERLTADPNATPAAAPEDSSQPYSEITASPDGTVTASPAAPDASDEPADTSAQPAVDGSADPNAAVKPEDANEQNNSERSGGSALPYVIGGVAAVGAVCGAIAVFMKKKRG